MGKLRLMMPKPEHKERVMNFRKEFLNAGEKVSERVFLAFDDHNDLISISDLRLGTNDFINYDLPLKRMDVLPVERNLKKSRKRLSTAHISGKKRPSKNNPYPKPYMVCRCDCGNITEVALNRLKSGQAIKCRRCHTNTVEWALENNKVKHNNLKKHAYP